MNAASTKHTSPASTLLRVACLLVVFASSAHAQNPSKDRDFDKRQPTFSTGTPPNRNPSIREREFKMREMEKEASRPPTPDEARLALEQIGEDYERIQAINNRMMSAATNGDRPLDYKHISEATAEIRRRANRLRQNLKLPKPENPEERPPVQKSGDDAQLKNSLLALDKIIMSFIKSPIFKNPDVVDTRQVFKASGDLDLIIEFAQAISKDAERLGKSAKKP